MHHELDVLGQQLQLAIQFAESGFANIELHDAVLGEDVMAHTFFSQNVNGIKTDIWFMRNESMPGHFAIKAIAVDEATLYVETAPLNPQEIEPTIAERALSITFSTKNGTFINGDTTRPLITIENAVIVKHDNITFAPRCLWKADLTKLDRGERQVAVELIDAFFDHEAFDLTDMVEEYEPQRRAKQKRAPRTELRLQMQLLHQLRIEQRPLLAHFLNHQQNVTAEGRLELQMLLRLQQAILHMQPEKLAEFAAQYTIEHGEAKTRNLFTFVLAGRIKGMAPNMSWKQVRSLARRIVFRAQNQAR